MDESAQGDVHDPERDEVISALGAQLGALLTAGKSLHRVAASELHPELQPAAYHVARWLSTAGPTTPAAVADGVGMDRSAVSRLLRELREFGLVEMVPDPEDGRSRIISLTPDAAAKLSQVRAYNRSEFVRRTAGLGIDELRELTRLLGRLTGPA
jgi:DNA-binding MarR family transcriptional regulator